MKNKTMSQNKTDERNRQGTDDEESDEERARRLVLPWINKTLGAPISETVYFHVEKALTRDYPLTHPKEWDDDYRKELLEHVRFELGTEEARKELLRKQDRRRRATVDDAERQQRVENDLKNNAGRAITSIKDRTPRLPIPGIVKEPEVELQKIRALLTRSDRSELACAKAIAEYFASLIATAPEVQQFRNRVLGSGRLLSTDEANAWIKSPLVRFCGMDRLWFLAEKPGVLSVLPLARIIRFEGWEIDAEIAKQYDVLGELPLWLSPDEPFEAFFVDIAIEGKDGTDNSTNNGIRQVMEIRIILYPDGRILSPYFLREGKENLEGGTDKSSEEDYFENEYPDMFPGSVADDLLRLSQGVSERLPFESSDVAWYIMTGEVPEYLPVRITRQRTNCASAKESSIYEMQTESKSSQDPLRKMRETLKRSLHPSGDATKPILSSGYVPKHLPDMWTMRGGEQVKDYSNTVRGYIRIEAEPWVSAETIADCWRTWQQEAISGDSSNSGTSTSQRNRVPRPEVAKLIGTVARAWRNEIVAGTGKRMSSGNSQAAVSAPVMTPSSLYHLHDQLCKAWQREASEASSLPGRTGINNSPKPRDYSNFPAFLRAYKQACLNLDLPHDLRAFAAALWEEHRT